MSLAQMAGKNVVERDNQFPDLTGESPPLAGNVAHNLSRVKRLDEKEREV